MINIFEGQCRNKKHFSRMMCKFYYITYLTCYFAKKLWNMEYRLQSVLDWKKRTKQYISGYIRHVFLLCLKKMKRTLWRRFLLSPVIIGVIWLLVSLVFWLLGTMWVTSLELDIVKNFINRWLGILALLSIILVIIGIIFLYTSIIKETIKYSRAAAKKHMSKFLLWFAIYAVLQIISSVFGYSADLGNVSMINAVITFLVLFGIMWITLWYKNLSLHIVRDASKARFTDVFVGFKKTLNFLWAYILVYLIIIIWLLLLIVPWIIFWLKLRMVPYLILDKNVGPIKAIKMSWKMTTWFLGDIFVLNILVGLINVLWILVVFVWLLRTLPLFMIANAYLYKKITALQKK